MGSYSTTNTMSSQTTLSKKFRKAFEKGLDKLFPETDDSTYIYGMGMQPFQPTSCHVSIYGAGSFPKHLQKCSLSYPNLKSHESDVTCSNSSIISSSSSSESLTRH